MKTKIEIINETVAYYSEDPLRRGLFRGYCQYITIDGRMCAVGRCMIDPRTESPDAQIGQIERFERKLKAEYRGYTKRFWGELQRLHDVSEHWNEEGLTKEGEIFLQALKEYHE